MYALVSPALGRRWADPLPSNLTRYLKSGPFENLILRRWAGETRAYIGQTEKWQNIGPITVNLDETKWDRTLPLGRTFLGGSGGRRGPNWGIWGVGDPRML